jgi:hypothetical protein
MFGVPAHMAHAHNVPAKTFLPKRSQQNVPENKVPEKKAPGNQGHGSAHWSGDGKMLHSKKHLFFAIKLTFSQICQ